MSVLRAGLAGVLRFSATPALFLCAALCGRALLAQAATDNTAHPPAAVATEPAPASGGAPSVDPAKTPLAMQPLLQARQNVGKFFEQAANVVCAESITQTIVGKNDKPAYREESKFDYQLEATAASGSLRLKESRDVRKQAFRDASRTLLLTKGFTSLLLIVHAQYEASYDFTPAGEENDGTVILAKYNFKAVPGASSPAALQLRGKNYPLPLTGTLWVNTSTGAITRLTAAVDSSLADLGLKSMHSDIHYALVQFHDPEEAYWMPVSATIDLETPLQHWRNVHRFTGYKRFRGSIQIEGIKDEKK
jgi:hypothetical protein